MFFYNSHIGPWALPAACLLGNLECKGAGAEGRQLNFIWCRG